MHNCAIVHIPPLIKCGPKVLGALPKNSLASKHAPMYGENRTNGGKKLSMEENSLFLFIPHLIAAIAASKQLLYKL